MDDRKERRMRLIDADALKAAMYHEAFENDASYDEKNPLAKWDSGLWVRYKMFERCLDSATSIDAVKHGRWIRTTKADYTWECSACGYGLCDNRTTYCYDCGARMDGEENG